MNFVRAGAAVFSRTAFLRCFIVKSPAVRPSSASPPIAPTPMPTPVPILFLHVRHVDSVVEAAIAQVEEVEGVVEVDDAIVVGKITCPLSNKNCPSVELQHELPKLGPQQKVWPPQKNICCEL